MGPPRPQTSRPQLLQPAWAHLGVLRVDLLSIDLRVTGYQAAPPLHLVDLRGRGGPPGDGWWLTLDPGDQPPSSSRTKLSPSHILHQGLARPELGPRGRWARPLPSPVAGGDRHGDRQHDKGKNKVPREILTQVEGEVRTTHMGWALNDSHEPR